MSRIEISGVLITLGNTGDGPKDSAASPPRWEELTVSAAAGAPPKLAPGVTISLGNRRDELGQHGDGEEQGGSGPRILVIKTCLRDVFLAVPESGAADEGETVTQREFLLPPPFTTESLRGPWFFGLSSNRALTMAALIKRLAALYHGPLPLDALLANALTSSNSSNSGGGGRTGGDALGGAGNGKLAGTVGGGGAEDDDDPRGEDGEGDVDEDRDAEDQGDDDAGGGLWEPGEGEDDDVDAIGDGEDDFGAADGDGDGDDDEGEGHRVTPGDDDEDDDDVGGEARRGSHGGGHRSEDDQGAEDDDGEGDDDDGPSSSTMKGKAKPRAKAKPSLGNGSPAGVKQKSSAGKQQPASLGGAKAAGKSAKAVALPEVAASAPEKKRGRPPAGPKSADASGKRGKKRALEQ